MIVHAEPGEDRAKYATDVANWILERATGQPQPGPTTGVSSVAAGPKL